MDNIEKLIECFKTHIGSKDKISPYSCTKKGKGGEFIFLDGVKPDEKLLVCNVSVCNAVKDVGQIEFGKITNSPLSDNTCPIDTIPRGLKGVPQFKDTFFWVCG